MDHKRSCLLIISLIAIILATQCTSETPTPTSSPLPPATTSAPPPATSTPVMGLELLDDGSPLPPQVLKIQPRGGQELPLDGSIEITFDQPMDQSTLNEAWKMVDAEEKQVSGEFTWPTPRILRFAPSDSLQSGEIYLVRLSTGVRSAESVPLLEALTFQFNAVGDLQVSQVFPGASAAEVENNAVVTVVFNRPVVPLVILEDRDDLPNPLEISPPISGNGEWLSTSVYIFRPGEPLRASTTYSARVPAGLTDTTGAQLAEDYDWEFTTVAPTIGEFTLVGSTIDPPDYFPDVLPDQSFAIGFRQPMDQTSTERAFSIISLNGEPVDVIFAWDDDNTRVVITPTRWLSLATDYTLELGQDAQAAGGGSLDEGLSWNFFTLPYPGINFVSPTDGEVQSHYSSRLWVVFESPMNLDTVYDRITISPNPDEQPRWYYNEWDWSITFYGLQPSTRYTVQFLPGMSDIYGNLITEGRIVNFTTAALDPSARLELPYAPVIYRLGGPREFFASAVNVETFDFKLYQLYTNTFVDLISGKQNRWEYTPASQTLLKEWHKVNTGKLNQRSFTSIPLETQDGSSLPPGFYFLTMDSPQVSHQGPFLHTRLLIVANANLTFKTTQTEGLMWLTDLETGDPLDGIPLTVFNQDFHPIGHGITGSDGTLNLDDLPKPSKSYESRFVLTEDGEIFAFADSDWGSGVSPFDFGIWSDYYTPPNQPTTYIYTDRPLYRPGQPVSFKGIVRLNDDLVYSLPPYKQIEVTINSYDEQVYEEILPLSEYGSFDGELLLDNEAALGYYTIDAKFSGSLDSIGEVGFSVAEYRKPEFQVNVEVSDEDVLGGETFTVNISAEFFSGGGVADADVHWAMRAADYIFSPGGELSRYNFTDYDRDAGYYYGYYEPGSDIIAEGFDHTDHEGKLQVMVPADLSEAGTSQLFTFEATVTDLAGNDVSDRTTITAHQAAVYPGVRPKQYVGVAGQEGTFELVVVDWDAEPVRGQLVDVEIVERRWYSVQEQDEQGHVHWTSSVEEIPVQRYEDVMMDGSGRASVRFTPFNGGVYKAILTAVDQWGNQAQASAYMWVSSSDYVSWRQTNDRRIELIADKDAYSPGEVAEILIASPFEGQTYALITVERGHIKNHEIKQLTSNSTIHLLSITTDMAPNVYVSVMIIKGNSGISPPDFRVGMVEIQVATDEQAITVELTPDRDQVGPGEDVSYNIRTTNHLGEPVSAEVSLALADLAALSLSAPNSSPILDHFYANRSLSVRTAMPIVLNIDHYIPTLEDQITDGIGSGSGGGKGAGDYGVFEIRGDFRDTAYWNARMLTDSDGLSSVTVTLPDNLTIWRMDARAVTLDTLVGDSTDDIRSTKPLLVRPQTPRFFIVGDQATLSAAVHNNTDETITANVSLQVEGISLKTSVSQEVEIPAQSQVYPTWDVGVHQDTERVDLVFTVEGGGYSDASRPTLGTLEGQGIPVYKYEAPETVGTAGMLTESGSRIEAINLPTDFDVTQGELTIQLAPSLAAGMTDGLNYLEHFPYECTEQIVSRFLPNVLTTQALSAAGLSDPQLEADLKEQVSIGLQRLYNHQRVDGGWGWWPDSRESDVLVSSYVILGFVEAENAGYSIDEIALRRGISYLARSLKYPNSRDPQYVLNRMTFTLYVLTRAGELSPSRAGQLFDLRQSLSLYARAYLAEILYRIDVEDPRLDTLISDFVNAAVLSATGAHWEEEVRDYWNWNTDTRTTAIVLASLIRIDADNALNANTVRWLMNHRTGGHWRTTQETAWTLMALTNWLVATGELDANYAYAVGLNGERLGDGEANADSIRQSTQYTVDIVDMLTETPNRLIIARDEGPGNLYFTAHMNLSLPVEEIEANDQGIIVSRSYFHSNHTQDNTPSPTGEEAPGLGSQGSTPENPITQAQQGDLLLARLTVVVPNSLHYVIIDDPLPAGLEAVDQSLETSPQVTAPEQYDHEDIWQRGWGWWYFDHIELRDEKVVISADYLPPGTYTYTYLIRASTPGEYRVIPPTAQEFYFPEVHGRGEGSLFTVLP